MQPQSQAAKSYRAVKQRMVSGRLAPGERISERTLAGELGVSRTPLRAALARLERERLVERSETGALQVVRLDERAVDDIFACQLQLETLAVRLAIARAADDEIHELGQALERAERAYASGEVETTIAANTRFHNAMYELAHSEWLHAAFEPIQGQLLRIRVVITHLVRRPSFPQEHSAIYEALRDRDVDRAVEAATRHIETDHLVAKRHLQSVMVGHKRHARRESPSVGDAAEPIRQSRDGASG